MFASFFWYMPAVYLRLGGKIICQDNMPLYFLNMILRRDACYVLWRAYPTLK